MDNTLGLPGMRYVLLRLGEALTFVEMPPTHAYQLTALNHRLHKEIGKLTAHEVPSLPQAVAEFDNLDVTWVAPGASLRTLSGLAYVNELERDFAAVEEKSYPLVSLLTEIRALQAQLEQWYEEEA